MIKLKKIYKVKFLFPLQDNTTASTPSFLTAHSDPYDKRVRYFNVKSDAVHFLNLMLDTFNKQLPDFAYMIKKSNFSIKPVFKIERK